MDKIQAVGMPWFVEDDYEAFRSILPDRKWHPTFAEWEAAANQRKEALHHQGFRAFKAQVRSVLFVAWCADTGREVDTKALSAFASEAAYREITGNH